MCDVLRFWFDRGVDGFRVDAIHHLFEDEEGRDNPPDPDWREGMPPNGAGCKSGRSISPRFTHPSR